MIVVATFNVLAALWTMVVRRNAEVAILMSMGATGPQVARIFQVTGMVIGLSGALAGDVESWHGGARVLTRDEHGTVHLWDADTLEVIHSATNSSWAALAGDIAAIADAAGVELRAPTARCSPRSRRRPRCAAWRRAAATCGPRTRRRCARGAPTGSSS